MDNPKSRSTMYESLESFKKKYSIPLLLIEIILYTSLSTLFICTVRLAVYSPTILDSEFNKLDTSTSIFLGGYELYKTRLIFSDLGLGYPALYISFICSLITGLLLYSFFPQENRLKELWKSFFVFNLSVFGVLVTLFSIWGN